MATGSAGPTKVKEEEEDEDASAAPVGDETVPVPPAVVLEKLEALLQFGRVLLRFEDAAADGSWGVNGIASGQWRSFRSVQGGRCHLVDAEGAWATNGLDDWAETDVQWLSSLQEDATKLPTARSAQPTAAKPRRCRRAVFDFHRAEYVRKRQGMAKAKARGAFTRWQGGAAAKLAGKAPAVDAKLWTQEALEKKIAAFCEVVRSRLAEGSGEGGYEAFLTALLVRNEAALCRILVGHEDLCRQYRDMLPQAQKFDALLEAARRSRGGGPNGQAAANGSAVVGRPAAPVVHVAIDVEREVLRPLRQASSEVLTQLVRLVTMSTGLPANVRLSMLRYARLQASEAEGAAASSRQLFVLRGPPGAGKSTWAAEQLRFQVAFTAEEEPVALLTHVCAVDDFCGPRGAAATLDLAHARNEARVQLAIEAGIQPLYVDCPNMQLWEMAPYARMAHKAGYSVNFVSPAEFFPDWRSAEALAARCAARKPARAVTRERLEEQIRAFEELPEAADPDEAVRLTLVAERRGPRITCAAGAPAAPASAGSAAGQKRPAGDAVGKADAPPAKKAAVAKRPPPAKPAADADGDAGTPAPPVAAAGGGEEEACVAASLLRSFALRAKK